MTTIMKTVEVTGNRKINLELTVPQDVPEGQVEVQVTIKPIPRMNAERVRFEEFAGCLANSPAFSGDAMEIQREMRDEWE